MGADLIGDMCVGPIHIEEAQAKTAEKRAWEIVQALKVWYGDDEGEGEQPELLKGLDLVDIDKPYHMESLDFGGADIKAATKEDIDALVGEIVGFWNDPSSRDSVDRWISKTEKVIFCGEMSWGDEPSGYGYRMLKMAHILNILGELGIH